MTTEPQPNADIRITVEYRPGRWGKVFHLFDLDGREIVLQQKDAVKMARSILKIATEKEGKDHDKQATIHTRAGAAGATKTEAEGIATTTSPAADIQPRA